MTAALRARYLSDSVLTASPGRLLVMLYDRLVLDLGQAEESLRAGDRAAGADRLTHAQDILIELRATLDVDVWPGGPGLAALYGFLIAELNRANMRADADLAASCRTLIEPLRDAWRQAAATPTAATVA